MAVSGSQIVFPPLEHASFHCGHCTAPVFLCACSGVGHGKDYVLMGLPPLPSHPTPVERLVRWATITSAHPGTSHFDARRFVRDMVDRNMLFTMSLERERLSQIAEDHSRKLAEPSEAARLTALFAAGRLDGTHAAQLAALQALCEGAMDKLLMCDWAGMSPLEVALCQNAFQTSDPARYPLGDAGLQLVYDVIGVLTTVHRWAFSTRGWHLRLQAPAAPAPAMGFDYGADLPGSGLQLAGSGLRPAHGIGCDSLSSRSGESGLPEAWDPASPELAPLHEQAPLKQAISQDMSSIHLQDTSTPVTPM